MLFYHFQKKVLLTTCLVIVILYITKHQTDRISSLTSQVYYYLYPEKSIQCYHTKSETLPDISEAEPLKGRSIFFHETSCNSHFSGKIFITARQACAIESAARLHPNYEIHLLFASPGIFKFDGTESDRLLQALLSYNNVKIHHVDYGKYTKGTPVEDLYKTGKVEVSGYAQSHASDVLRYLTLWKYGGIYLDLDVVVIKSLENLPPNYAGSESSMNVAAGVLSFSPNGKGHNFAKMCLDDLRENFKGYDWGYNGPGVITRLLRQLCGVQEAKDMVQKSCQGFKVYPTQTFYAVPWLNWTMFFDESSTEEVFKLSRNSYVIHVWNKHSVNKKIPIRGKAPYLLFAQKYCPKVVNECDEFF